MANKDLLQASKLAQCTLDLVEGSIPTTSTAADQLIEQWLQVNAATVGSMGASSQLQLLQTRLGLSKESSMILCLLVLPYLDAAYSELARKLSGGKEKDQNLCSLACLVADSYPQLSSLLAGFSQSPVVRWNIVEKLNGPSFPNLCIKPSDSLVAFFSEVEMKPPGDLLTLCAGSPLNLSIDAQIAPVSGHLQIITGSFPERQLTVAIRLAANHYKRPLYQLNSDIVLSSGQPDDALRTAFGYVLLQNGMVYWQNALEELEKHPALIPIVSEWLKEEDTIFFMGEVQVMDVPGAFDILTTGSIRLQELPTDMEQTVWQQMGAVLLPGNNIDWKLIANTYSLNMQRLEQTMLRVKNTLDGDQKASTKAFQQCFMETSPRHIGNVFSLDPASGEMEAMVLTKAVIANLQMVEKAFVGHVFLGSGSKNKSVLLHGYPGTGKTMAAESLSNILKLPLYRLNTLAVADGGGEALSKAAAKAAMLSAIIVLDDVDQIFARGNVQSAPTGSLMAPMLQLLETYNGLIVMTARDLHGMSTLLTEKVDFTIGFDPFGAAQRGLLLQKLIAQKGVKLENESQMVSLISNQQLSGRDVSNVLDNAILFSRVAYEPLNNVVVLDKDLIQAIKNELS